MTTERYGYIGRSNTRREDWRLLTGNGTFVADIALPGMLDVALVRSQHAHAQILSVDTTKATDMPGVELCIGGVELATHLPALDGMQVSAPPGWAQQVRHTIALPSQDILATDRVRYVGEPLAAVVADGALRALDAAEVVSADLRPLAVVTDPEAASADTSALIHEQLGTNVIASMQVAKGAVTEALGSARHRLSRRIVHHRYAAMPMECRAVVADFDRRTGTLTVWSTTQVVHWVRGQLARALGLAEARVRVVAPDVGGGFGVKGHVYPEELLVAHLAMRLGRPVRWLEQRQEHFLGSTHSRDQIHNVEFAFDDDGLLLALRDECLIDSGAYCPVGAGVAYNTTSHMLGPYQVANFEATTTVVATNKAPNAPYRGAGRPEAVQVMERVLDLVATELDLEPAAVRFRNLIAPEQMPYSVGLPYRDGQPIIYDSGDYPKALQRVIDELGGIEDFRDRQRKALSQGRRLGLGLGCYTEGTGVGPFEGAQVRVDQSGKLIIAVGACAQGQGHETIFAQVAAHRWQVPLEDVLVTTGDSSAIAMGYGTVGSRSTVTTSMAIEDASSQVIEKVIAIAGELLEASPSDLELRNGGVSLRGAPELRVSLAQIARAAMPGWQSARPPGQSAGLEAAAYYEPPTVTWSYAANGAIVEVLGDTGEVVVERFVEVHDAGVLINPMLADGQVTGGIIQGVGGALMEAIIYDAQGQLLTGSFLDYAMPRAMDAPPLRIIHHQTPSPLNSLGVKGLGEGGAIAPPVVLANAVTDALRGTGAEFNTLPIRREDVRRACLGLRDPQR